MYSWIIQAHVYQYLSFIPPFYHSVVVLIIWCTSLFQFHTTFLPLGRCSHYMVCINISVSYHISTTLSLFSLYGVHQYLSFSVFVILILALRLQIRKHIYTTTTRSTPIDNKQVITLTSKICLIGMKQWIQTDLENNDKNSISRTL